MHCTVHEPTLHFSFYGCIISFFKAKHIMLVGNLAHLCCERSIMYAFYFIVKMSSNKCLAVFKSILKLNVSTFIWSRDCLSHQ